MLDLNKKKSSRVLDWFDNPENFEHLLTEAEMEAVSSKEMDFVDSLNEKYDEYGAKMFLSDRQLEWLQAIARGD
ncbi:MAG: hypothetical protein AAFV59_14330 [Pseudomonadota bacterium]